jgi:hypothetical protein
MPILAVLLLAAIAICATTWTFGWWGVVVGALVIGAVARRQRGIAWITALAAVIGWSLLLIVDAARGRFGALATTIAGVIRIPAAALLGVTLLFAALLAWSSAVVASEIVSGIDRRRRSEV